MAERLERIVSRTDKDAPYRLRRDQVPAWRLPWGSPPPAWFRRHRWTASDRFRARAAGLAAAGEHRAGLAPEAEPPTFQHRHGAAWDWR